MKRAAYFVVAPVLSVFAASCSFDLGSLQGGSSDTGVAGMGGTGGQVATTTTDGGIAGTGGGGIGRDAGVPDAPGAQPDVPIGGSVGGAGGISGVSGTGGGSTIPTGGTTRPSGGTIVSLGGTTGLTGGMAASGGISGSGGTSAGGIAPPSCSGLAATCGPLGNESCCASLRVPGGTFYRGYDGVAFGDMNYPATVSDFYLDKYEITVGRFRAFVNASMGTQANPPASGAGAHPLIAGSGWDSTWNMNLPTDTASLETAMKCDSTFQTWTDTPGGDENRPQNCMKWFEAAAFCAWDGGWLPTEAEWNYAASGGSEQRYYPWSSPPTSPTIDDSYAVYCGGSCSGTQNVGSKSPKGDGKWGQADLAGNVWEWTLDWYGNFPLPCDNCASLVPNYSRVVRGGGFDNIAYYVLVNVRISMPTSDYADIGSRCARMGGVGGGGDAGVPDAPGAQPDVPIGGSGGTNGGPESGPEPGPDAPPDLARDLAPDLTPDISPPPPDTSVDASICLQRFQANGYSLGTDASISACSSCSENGNSYESQCKTWIGCLQSSWPCARGDYCWMDCQNRVEGDAVLESCVWTLTSAACGSH